MSFTGWNDPFDIFFTTRNAVEPQTNVGHNGKEIVLQVALPGFSRSDIDVEVNNGRLMIRAKAQKQNDEYEYTTRDIRLTDYSRNWSLPKTVNTEAVEAAYDAGILTVRIPYNQNTRETVRKIELR
jgi:HSP20 family protein